MDRALKERIVGAIVLVVVAVLVVPVFLDGSAEQPEVMTESVTLPGQDGESRKRQTIVLDRDRSEPVPVPEKDAPRDTADAARSAPATTPAPAAAAAPADEAPSGPAQQESAGDGESAAGERSVAAASEAPPPQDDTPAASEAGSSTGMWAVQLGSFAQPDNAERLAADLRKEGYAAFLSQLEGPNGPLHRVRIGPQKDRASAEATAEKLAAAGHEGQVVPHP